MPSIGTDRVETAAVKATGIPITGCLRKFGIIILMAPRKMATCTPGLSTFRVAQIRKAAALARPKPAAAEPMPAKPMATEIATVESGVMMTMANDIAIRIHIGYGASLVKVLMTSPIPVVTKDT